jgi:hypothetical protein
MPFEIVSIDVFIHISTFFFHRVLTFFEHGILSFNIISTLFQH